MGLAFFFIVCAYTSNLGCRFALSQTLFYTVHFFTSTANSLPAVDISLLSCVSLARCSLYSDNMPSSLIMSISANLHAKTPWSCCSWKLSHAQFGGCSDGSYNISAIFRKDCYRPMAINNLTTLPPGTCRRVMDSMLNDGMPSPANSSLVHSPLCLFSLGQSSTPFCVYAVLSATWWRLRKLQLSELLRPLRLHGCVISFIIGMLPS